jgi:SAM-dependent methyltransferase
MARAARPHDPGIAQRNCVAWDRWSDSYQSRHGPLIGGDHAEAWGLWRVPESQIKVLDDAAGHDVLEVGCGAASWSCALARRGARVTGVDISARQLAYASAAVGCSVHLILANAENLPLAEGSFDIALSDYGAMTWADPYLTVPEISRVLRPGGLLAFCTNSPLFEMCWNPDARELLPHLREGYFALHARKSRQGASYYVLPHGEWIDLFAENGMAVERLIERPPPPGAHTTFTGRTVDWCQNWPAETIWRVRKMR